MQDAEKYRQFAKDCLRLAAGAKGEDKSVLMEIAEAWQQQARLAETSRAKKTNSQAAPDADACCKAHPTV